MSDQISIQKSFLLMGRSGNGINLLVNSILFKSQRDFADKGDFCVTAPGVTVQGVTDVGVTAPCVTAPGVRAPGVTAQGIKAQSVKDVSVTAQGVTDQGVIVDGVTSSGVTEPKHEACDDKDFMVCGDTACYKIKVGDDYHVNNINYLFDKLTRAFNCCTQGFTAVLIVLKYGVRFTKQEKDAISLIKDVLGEDCIRNYGVIVFTHGDNFDLDHKDGDIYTNFSAWCGEQRGDIQRLFDEVKYRCVIFDNRTTDENKINLQMNQLLKQIVTLEHGFYTRLLFCKSLVSVSKVEFERLEKIADIENFKFEAAFLWKKLGTLERLLGEKHVDQPRKTIHEDKENLITTLINLHTKKINTGSNLP